MQRMELYDSGTEYVARRHISVAGVTYAQGDVVPRAGVTERVYKRLFATRRIVLNDEKMLTRGTAAAAQIGAAVSEAPRARPQQAAQTKPVDDVRIDDPAGGTVAKAKGWVQVWHGGELVKTVRGQEAADALLAELRGDVAPVAAHATALSAEGGEVEASNMGFTEPGLGDDETAPWIDEGDEYDEPTRGAAA